MHDPSLIGENIKKYRKLLNLTQSELAEKLYVTTQNVSKWETGKSLPDINNLCLLSDILGISADKLLGAMENGERGRVMIGIDGGGTKTEFCLFTERGEILSRLVLEGINPNVSGMDNALSTLKRGIDTLITQELDTAAIFLGMAGGGISNKKTVKAFLKKNYPSIKIEVESDTYNVVYSTKYVDRCIVAIAGTGSVVCVKHRDGVERIGGHGYLFDRSYNGFEIGRAALRAVLSEEEGMGEPTLLTPLVEKRLGARVCDSMEVLYREKKEFIASFARMVFEAYDNGDKIAKNIIESGLEELLVLIDKAAATYDCGKRVVITGGLNARRDIILDFFARRAPRYEISFPTLPPIYGACAYCNRMFGDPSPEFAANFEKNYIHYKEKENA